MPNMCIYFKDFYDYVKIVVSIVQSYLFVYLCFQKCHATFAGTSNICWHIHKFKF